MVLPFFLPASAGGRGGWGGAFCFAVLSLLLVSPLCRNGLRLPAEGICHYVVRPTDELRPENNSSVLCLLCCASSLSVEE
ncbi:hypothetical protein E2C01_004737 [Portunus trituberculatus]|uniref:Uncharacterized protein n=1 Tax=Portunus trituberculatus TaxID=210409 RepID=A0A5B7CRC5_PORTR|nr:hypothetical protein [Portunus trituberculatus]